MAGAQGARPPARPALRAPQRLRRAVDWKGDAKLAGVVEEIPDPEENGGEPSHRFRLDLREVSTVGLDDKRTHLVIDVWTLEGGVRTIKRK